MNKTATDEQGLINYLLSPGAIRDRCQTILQLAEQDELEHFQYQPENLAPVANYVQAVIQSNYPTLDIPYHSRWRHFDVGGIDRVAHLQQTWNAIDLIEQGRRLYELGITSVLLDAGAGEAWRYHEPTTQQMFARSEGLAIASFDLYQNGGFSSISSRPFLADESGLTGFDMETLQQAFQINDENPLLGVEGRCRIVAQLGSVVGNNPAIFGENQPRLGHLFDYFLELVEDNQLSAVTILKTILETFGNIWPGRIQLGDMNLGDCWRHSGLQTSERGSALIPFHKLSQWLTYSLLEPLQMTGVTITDLNDLTGLAEYRNGGLLLDLDLIRLRNPTAVQQSHPVDSPLIIEWRALTVALLDRLAAHIRSSLELDTETFPLAKVLQGGTWSAGRKIAKEKRPSGAPPLKIISDGTVF